MLLLIAGMTVLFIASAMIAILFILAVMFFVGIFPFIYRSLFAALIMYLIYLAYKERRNERIE